VEKRSRHAWLSSEPLNKTDFTPAFLPVLVRQPAWLLAFWRFDFFTM
jgi:hypothetical protein